ncbi:MAG: class I SAM-dependent methyltransferase [Paracoccaceae bacterium]
MRDDIQIRVSGWSERLATGDQPQIAATVHAMVDELTAWRDSLPPADWEETILALRGSELLPLLLEDPFTRWSYHRPRGFPGDAGLIDFIYAQGAFGDSLRGASATGQWIYCANQTRPACKAVRYRKQIASEFLREVMAATARPAVLAIAAGHLREVETEVLRGAGLAGRIVALDQDPTALDCIAERLPDVERLRLSVRDLLMGRLDGQLFDATYSLGLYDYLSDAAAERLLRKQVELVRPGGRILICNFAPDAADRGYMEAFMDWKLIYRDEQDMETLAFRAHSGCATRVYREPSGQIVFLELGV